jgi:hypothetical protein
VRWGGRVAALLVSVVALGACGSEGEPTADIDLDGSRRDPDVEGVVEEVSLDDITIDGRRYELSENLLAFNTYTLVALPVLRTEGSYVHAGTKSGKVVWLAEVAKVIDRGDRALGYYRGTLLERDGDRLVFQDGTVLRAGDDVEVPAPPVALLVGLDPDGDVVVSVGAP